jgi:hypothetical protein
MADRAPFAAPFYDRRLAGWWRWAAVLTPGLLLYLLPLSGLNVVQRHLLAIFAATIVALVAQPLPMGASVVVAMTLLALTGTLPPAKVLSGFSNITVWLIFLAFLFGRAFTITGSASASGIFSCGGSRAVRSAWDTLWPRPIWCWRRSSRRTQPAAAA